MTRRVGRYTKDETTELIRMFNDGYSVYKICRNLNRSQKSIKNNLIRLGLIDGVITPLRTKPKSVEVEETHSQRPYLYGLFLRLFFIFLFTLIFVVEPSFNILEIILIIIFYDWYDKLAFI